MSAHFFAGIRFGWRVAIARRFRSFNGKFRDECLNREWFRDFREARVLIEQWREFYNHCRPHSSLGNRISVQARQEALKI